MELRQPELEFREVDVVFLELAEGEMILGSFLCQLRMELAALFDELSVLILHLARKARNDVLLLRFIEEAHMQKACRALAAEDFLIELVQFLLDGTNGRYNADRILKVEDPQRLQLSPDVGAVRGRAGWHLVEEEKPCGGIFHGAIIPRLSEYNTSCTPSADGVSSNETGVA